MVGIKKIKNKYMSTKKEWIEYLVKLEKYAKDLKTWVKKLPDGEVSTQDAGPGSNPPTPPPPPPHP